MVGFPVAGFIVSVKHLVDNLEATERYRVLLADAVGIQICCNISECV